MVTIRHLNYINMAKTQSITPEDVNISIPTVSELKSACSVSLDYWLSKLIITVSAKNKTLAISS